MAATHYQNPVIQGFSPDPSVCVVGDDFYLVNSTFSYFPGIPIFHSRDMVHWLQIGNVLSRSSQVNLTGNNIAAGIFAPTIRYHQGTFYVICTNIGHEGNFVVSAQDPAGPWSDPVFITEADGIDPSLFFAPDGRIYYTGTHDRATGAAYPGDNDIYLAELDPATWQIKGPKHPVWHGALRGSAWAEGPHLYYRHGYYYLMIAEGGTYHHHAITIARSKNITGPYTGNPDNPILTHRHLGQDYPVANVGHGDLVASPNGSWYLVCLASRKVAGRVNLGRETFIANVSWADDWPVINPGVGRLSTTGTIDLPPAPVQQPTATIIFDQPLDPRLLFLRNPVPANYQYPGDHTVRLTPTTVDLTAPASPTFIGVRQRSMTMLFRVEFSTLPATANQVGITVFQTDQYYIKFFVTTEAGQSSLKVIQAAGGEETTISSWPVHTAIRTLCFRQNGQTLSCGYRNTTDPTYHWLDIAVDTRSLSTEIAGGFTGCVNAVFAVGPDKTPIVLRSLSTDAPAVN